MKNKWKYLIIVVLLITGFIFLNQGILNQNNTKTYNAQSKKLQVTASFYPLFFFAQEIGKEKADVKNITPSGSEPHDYEPTTQDIARIESGKLLILNGGVEAWGDKIIDTLISKNVKVIVAGEGLLTQQIEEEGKNNLDPHIWLSPDLAKKETHSITLGFISIDPGNRSYYENNEKKLDYKLDQLDIKFKQGLQNCKSRDIVTSHAAFAYLAKQYELNQVAISGLSPDVEPSAQQLAEVASFAKKNNVKYIFFETLVSPKLAETIASEIGAKTMVLDPIEGLSDDDIKQGENYFTVMENNLKNLQEVLSCIK